MMFHVYALFYFFCLVKLSLFVCLMWDVIMYPFLHTMSLSSSKGRPKVNTFMFIIDPTVNPWCFMCMFILFVFFCWVKSSHFACLMRDVIMYPFFHTMPLSSSKGGPKIKTFMLIIDPIVNPWCFMPMLILFYFFLLSEAASLCVFNVGCM